MKYKLGNIELSISENVIAIFSSYKQDTKSKNESGGVLFGQTQESNYHLVRASTPNSFDKAGRFWFERNKNAAQILINFEFINSIRKNAYVGEWHTHPEENPSPSDQDRKMIKEQFVKNTGFGSFLFLIIQGTKSLYVAVYNGKELTEMDEIQEEV